MGLNEFQDEKVKGRQADVVLAAFHAMEIALRLVKPGGEVSFLLNHSKNNLCMLKVLNYLYVIGGCFVLVYCSALLTFLLLCVCWFTSWLRDVKQNFTTVVHSE